MQYDMILFMIQYIEHLIIPTIILQTLGTKGYNNVEFFNHLNNTQLLSIKPKRQLIYFDFKFCIISKWTMANDNQLCFHFKRSSLIQSLNCCSVF